MRKNYPEMHDPMRLKHLAINPIREYRECYKDFRILSMENPHAIPYGCRLRFVANIEKIDWAKKAGLIADLFLYHLVNDIPMRPGPNPEE